MHTNNQIFTPVEIHRIMTDGRFDRACKTVESLTLAGVPWLVTMYVVASDVEELAIDLREFDPALEALYERVEAATARGDQEEIKEADVAWCKRADEIQARIFGWVGLPRAQKVLKVSRAAYQEFLRHAGLAATRDVVLQGRG